MLNHFRRQVIVSLIIILGSAGVAIAAISWLKRDIQFQAGKIFDDKNLISKRVAILADLAELKKLTSKADAYKRAMNAIMLTHEDLLNFPRRLEDLARVHRLGISFSFRGEEVKPQENKPGYVNFNVDVVGAVDNLISFIKDVEYRSLGFIATFDSVDFLKSGDNYKASLQGKVFFR